MSALHHLKQITFDATKPLGMTLQPLLDAEHGLNENRLFWVQACTGQAVPLDVKAGDLVLGVNGTMQNANPTGIRTAVADARDSPNDGKVFLSLLRNYVHDQRGCPLESAELIERDFSVKESLGLTLRAVTTHGMTSSVVVGVIPGAQGQRLGIKINDAILTVCNEVQHDGAMTLQRIKESLTVAKASNQQLIKIIFYRCTDIQKSSGGDDKKKVNVGDMFKKSVFGNMFKKKEMSGGGDNVKNVFGGLFKKKDSNVAVSKSASTNAASTETNIVSKAEAAMTTPKVTTQDVFAGLFSKKDQPQPSEPKHQPEELLASNAEINNHPSNIMEDKMSSNDLVNNSQKGSSITMGDLFDNDNTQEHSEKTSELKEMSVNQSQSCSEDKKKIVALTNTLEHSRSATIRAETTLESEKTRHIAILNKSTKEKNDLQSKLIQERKQHEDKLKIKEQEFQSQLMNERTQHDKLLTQKESEYATSLRNKSQVCADLEKKLKEALAKVSSLESAVESSVDEANALAVSAKDDAVAEALQKQADASQEMTRKRDALWLVAVQQLLKSQAGAVSSQKVKTISALDTIDAKVQNLVTTLNDVAL